MLGNIIKDYLDERGIKYSFVSQKTAIPMNVLSPSLNEKREIKAEEYFKICEALEVPLEQFVNKSRLPDEKGEYLLEERPEADIMKGCKGVKSDKGGK